MANPLDDDASDSPMVALAKRRAREWRALQLRAAQLANRHDRWHHVLGLPSVILAAPTVVVLIALEAPAIAPLVAALAGALAAAWGFLGEKRLKELHWGRHDCLKEVADRGETLVTRGGEPTQAELDDLGAAERACGDAGRRDSQPAAAETASR